MNHNTLSEYTLTDPTSLTDNHAFHNAHQDNITSILKHGLEPQTHPETDYPDEYFLKNAAEQANITLPIDRHHSTFFYLTRERLKTVMDTNNYAIVIDTTTISKQMAVADMSAYDDLLHKTPVNLEQAKHGEYTQPQLDAVKQYTTTLTPVSNASEAQTIATQQNFDTPELIIESKIHPDKIIGIIKHYQL